MAAITGDSRIVVPPSTPAADAIVGWSVPVQVGVLQRQQGHSVTVNTLGAQIAGAIEARIAGLEGRPLDRQALREQQYGLAHELVAAWFPADAGSALQQSLAGYELMAHLGVAPADLLRQHTGQNLN